jgi:tetratricopeptide (TPR) repeat protein
MALSQIFMKRKKNHQGFHKRAQGSAASPSLLHSIRNTLQSGDYAGALAAINQAVAGASDVGVQSELLSLAGDCLFRQGKYAEAAEAFGRIYDPVQNQPAFWLRPAIGQIYSLLKDVQVDAAQAKALAAMQTAQTFYQQYQTQLVQAQATVAAGGQAAIPAEPPQPAKVASRLGKIFFSEGEVPVAKTLFQQAIQLEPNSHKALLGLAEIALRENNPVAAITHARQALASNHYHAETLSAWPILLAAGRQSGTDVLDASLLNSLSQSPSAVRARAVLLIAKNLRGQGDARWQQISTDWLQSAGTTNPIIAAELLKLNLAQTRITNASVASRQQRAQALLQTPGISPTEWLAATKQVIATALSLNQAPNLDALVAQGVSSFGAKLGPVFAHSIALACQKAGRADLAAPLFQRNIADTTATAAEIGKSLWALARLQSQQGDHVDSAQSYWAYSQNTSVPQRFHVFGLLQWVNELIATGQPDLIVQAKPQIEAVLPQITDYELVLDLARQVFFLPAGHSTWRDFALQIYQQGKQLALQAFKATGHPAVAATILYKFSRRASNDFQDGDAVLSTWSQLTDAKKQWLWSEQQDYWHYLELVFRAYRDAKRYPEAEQFITPLLNDPATPPHGYAILGASYATMKRAQGDFTTMFSVYTRMTQVAPTHEWTGAAYYWFALQAWKQGNATQTSAFAAKLLLALGKDCTLYWKRNLAAKALCLKAGLNLLQIPAQTNVSADTLQAQLKVIQTDLALLNS